MEMTYSELQTPLFPPSYVNVENKKDHWKIGESEHNTDCDVTLGITNSYAPNICITYTHPCSRPAASRTIRSSAAKERWLRMTANDLQILSTTDKCLIL